MNKITEFKQQAEIYTDVSGRWIHESDLEKFAELIVMECSQFLVDKFDFCGNEILAAEELAKNFGVKWTFRIEE
jgi:hypothetical protein